MDTTILENADNSTKKPFNKKEWRQKKYSTKYKVQRWQETRRKQVEKDYNKLLIEEGIAIKTNYNTNKEKTKKSTFQTVINKKTDEKNRKKEERERIQKERLQAIKEYKEKKAKKFRILTQKTKKGQPAMRGRMELLLEKIEKEYGPKNK